MKSIKLITIILSLMVASAHATSPQSDFIEVSDWPKHWVDDEVDICAIPVYMELPGFAKVLNQDELEIRIKSLDLDTYAGCTDFELIAAIDVVLGCRIQSNGTVGGDYSCSIENAQVDATGPTTPAVRTACVRLDNVDFSYLPAPGEGLNVATLTLTIAPL
jgi:hypothetical protein